MRKTANSIVREHAWSAISTKSPLELLKKFRKALIDSEVTPNQALIAFMHAVGTGQIRLEPKQVCRDYRGVGLIFDQTGVFDDYRPIMRAADGRIINPLPYSNDFVEKI